MPAGALKRGTANCQNVAIWLGLPAERGVFLLFAFDKQEKYLGTPEAQGHAKVLKMLKRMEKTNGREIYYD